MNTFYARHTTRLDIDRATLECLWEKRKIAIHFPNHGVDFDVAMPDNSSINPQDYHYRSGRNAMLAFSRLSSEGGYVLAEYAHHSDCLVGMIKPGTEIEIYRGKWGSVNNLVGREAVLKTLQLVYPQVVPPDRSARLLAGRPRQGTVMRWPSALNIIKNCVEGIAGLQTLRDLTPSLQETLCAEFMRLPSEQTGLPKLAHLILPVGRTMRDLDIYGIDTAGGVIAAQVTLQLSNNCPGKVAALKKFTGGNVQRIFFCEDSEARLYEGINYYRLEDAYSKFVMTTTGKLWLAEVSR